MKVLRTAVQIVGIIATIASFIPGPHQPIAAAIATAASVASAALALMSRPPKPEARGSPTSYLLDPGIGIPCMLGRTQFAGCCGKRETWGSENKNQAFLSIYSIGPVDGFEQFTADKVEIDFKPASDPSDPWDAIGQLGGYLRFNYQLGECPSPPLVCPGTPTNNQPPGWNNASSKVSGLFASWMWLRWDKNQRYFTSGPPVPGVVARGVKVYDPRLDSTFPGGSGACRAGQDETYVYSETPHLHALTYLLGRYQNGKRRFGIGFPVEAIDVEYFAEAASIDEANGWKVGGLIWSTDEKWNTLKRIMIAGCAEPITLGGKISGLQTAPRVSSATITSDDLVGPSGYTPTQTQRERVNGLVPRYRSENHGWEMVPAVVVRVPAFVALDGSDRTKEVTYELVQQNKQARELAGYQIYNSREAGPIDLTVKLRWYGLRPGDCVTLDIPELNLIAQKAVVITRSLDVQTGAVTLRLKTEDDQKHADVMGIIVGEVPIPGPPQPPINSENPPPAPPPGQWVLTGTQITGGPMQTLKPAFMITGTPFNTIAEFVEFSYRVVGTETWVVKAPVEAPASPYYIKNLVPGVSYEVRVREIVATIPSLPLVLGPLAFPDEELDWEVIVGPTAPQDGATAGENVFDSPRDFQDYTKWHVE